ncbi:MAG: hypothetical protein WCG73_03515, partial [Candidatus Moraniibacteriota bacterium]
MATEENHEAITNDVQKGEEKLPPKRKRKLWFFLFFLTLLIGGLYSCWQFFQSPAVGVIRPGALPKKDESFAEGTETKHFVGKHFSFSYPGAYQEISHTLPETGPIKETIFLSAVDVEGKKIAVTEEERENDRLDASPAFQMRERDTKTYRKSSFKWDGLDRVLFTKDSQVFEKAVFLQKKNFILTVS